MPIKEINEILSNCKRPIDFFGNIPIEDIHKKYRKVAKCCHPDLVDKEENALAKETTILLNAIYEQAQEEIESGIYNVTKEELYTKKIPIIEFDIDNNSYKFYDYFQNNDTSDIYIGLCNAKELVYLEIINEEEDNDLIKNEYQILSRLNHYSLPKIKDKLNINGLSSIILNNIKGKTIKEIINEYGYIDGDHIMWILERLLSIVGYLHSNNIVHGNIKESNIIIDPELHNVMILDYTLGIDKAVEITSKYRIINEDYSPSYVNSNARVIPNVDIYAIGKIAIKLIGGDIKNNGMPISIDIRLRNFIRKLVSTSRSNLPNDAWVLWDELIKLRNELSGEERFKKLVRKNKEVF